MTHRALNLCAVGEETTGMSANKNKNQGSKETFYLINNSVEVENYTGLQPACKAAQSWDDGSVFESHHGLQHPSLQGTHDQHAEGHHQGQQGVGAAHGHCDQCQREFREVKMETGECSLAEGILTTEKVRMCKSKFTVQKVPARHQLQPIKLEQETSAPILNQS